MLHQETGVDSDKNRGGEITQETQYLACCVGVVDGGLLGEGAGASLAHRGDDACGCVENQEAVGEGDKNGGCDGAEDGGDDVEGSVDDGGEERQGVHERCVRGHDDRRQRREVTSLCGRGDLFNRMGRLVVCEDLVDAEHDVGEEEGALDGVSAAAADTPGAKDDGACHRDADERGIDVGDLREL